MPIITLCPTCQIKLRIPDDAAGKKTKCPKCGLLLQVASFAPPEPPPPPPTAQVPVVRGHDAEDDQLSPRYRDDEDDDEYPRPRRFRREYEQPYRDPAYPSKSRVAYIVLAIFMGGLGVHNFYAARTTPGLLQLLLNLFNLTMFALGFCTLVTFFVAAVGAIAHFVWVMTDVCTVSRDGRGQPMT